MDRPPDLNVPTNARAAASLIELDECAGEPYRRVGRKAAVLGWASANGISTPGGVVIPAERLQAALSVVGALERTRYLEQSAFRLDPVHVFEIAGSIATAMQSPAVEALARADAAASFERLRAERVVCRSSSALEDGSRSAFPGVFLSVLDIESPDRLAAAIADCWRSAFSVDVLRYLLRRRVEPVDLSLALLLQGQVEASWFGVYASADPLTGDAEPRADLSGTAPDLVVSGQPPRLRARRRSGRWIGIDEDPSLAAQLELVHRSARRLASHVGQDVDVEFALPPGGDEPVILQCRPLTGVERRRRGGDRRPAVAAARVAGRSCAGGWATGVAVDPRLATINETTPSSIAVVDQLTTADYGIVFGSAGVITEQDTSSLSHVAILCRELGVPLVSAIADARSLLVGRRVAIDGESGEVEILESENDVASDEAQPAPGAMLLSVVELLLHVLVECRPGRPPAEEVDRIARRCARDLGVDSVRVSVNHIGFDELQKLDRLGTVLFGKRFSTEAFVAEYGGTRLDVGRRATRARARRPR